MDDEYFSQILYIGDEMIEEIYEKNARTLPKFKPGTIIVAGEHEHATDYDIILNL